MDSGPLGVWPCRLTGVACGAKKGRMLDPGRNNAMRLETWRYYIRIPYSVVVDFRQHRKNRHWNAYGCALSRYLGIQDDENGGPGENQDVSTHR
jgi:hypothetical protein